MNTYTPDGQFIIDTTGKEWPVNAWHAAGPLNGTPAGISALDENGNWSGEIAFKATDENRTGWWLARPPLPPVPLPTPTDLNDPKELRMSAEAFDWLEKHVPEIRYLIFCKFCPEQLKKQPLTGTIGGAIMVVEALRSRDRV